MVNLLRVVHGNHHEVVVVSLKCRGLEGHINWQLNIPSVAHTCRLLFRDFVEQGMQGSYWYFLLSQNTGDTSAPSYKIVLALKSNLFRQSILVWQPSLNVPTQGPVVWGEWNQQSFTEETGSTAPWPASIDDGKDVGGWWYVLCFPFFLPLALKHVSFDVRQSLTSIHKGAPRDVSWTFLRRQSHPICVRDPVVPRAHCRRF